MSFDSFSMFKFFDADGNIPSRFLESRRKYDIAEIVTINKFYKQIDKIYYDFNHVFCDINANEGKI